MLNLTLERIERQIRHLPVEHAFALDAGHNIVVHRTNDHRSRVAFTKSEIAAMAGAILTHNHPGGRSFSIRDLLLARDAGLSELRVVTSRNRYSLKPPVEGWDTCGRDEFMAVVGRERALLLEQLRGEIARGRMTSSLLDSVFHHHLCERLASLGLIQYRVETW
ncbi:MAG TPA: hypothetical protein VF092_29115 [Longimicrobium sp.]